MQKKFKILIIATIVIVLAFSFTIVENIYSSYSKTINFIVNENQKDAESVSHQFRMFLEERQHELFSYSILLSNSKDLDELSPYISKTNSQFELLMFIDSKNRVSILKNQVNGVDINKIISNIEIRKIHNQLVNDKNIPFDDIKFYTSKPVKIANNEYGLVLSIPALYQNKYSGSFIGVTSLNRLGNELLYKNPSLSVGRPFAISPDGVKIICYDISQLGRAYNDPSTKPTSDVLKNYKAMAEGKKINVYHTSYFRNGIFSPNLKPSTKLLSSYPISIDGDFKFSIGMISEVSSINFFNSRLIIEIVLCLLVIIFLVYLIIRIQKQIISEKEFQINSHFHELHAKELESLNKRIMEQNKTLESNNKELQEYNRIKTDFFANISHELRMPLTVILSSTQLMEKQSKAENYSEKTQKWIKIIKQNAQRLSRLVNNLLAISKIDSGTVILDKKNSDIVIFLKNLISSVEPFIESKGLKMHYNPSCGRKIIAIDKEKLEKVILNLLSNAIKFNKPGGEIFVSIVSTDKIYIEVSDTGIGIPEEKMDSIFQRFVQVNPTLTREHEGTGIGLSMCKEFIRLHDGDILVESQLGVGTKFTIILPNEKVDTCDVDNTVSSVNSISIEFSDIS